jgi:hypothetical protein
MFINAYQKAPTPQTIGTWLRRLGKDNQGVKALQKVNKTLLNLQKEVYLTFGCLWFSPNG